MRSRFKDRVAKYFKLAFYPCFFLAFIVPALYRVWASKSEKINGMVGDFGLWDYHLVLYLLFSIPSYMDLIWFCMPLKSIADLIHYWYLKKVFEQFSPCELNVMSANYGNKDKFMTKALQDLYGAWNFFALTVYLSHYDILKLLVEKHIIKQQDQSLRQYFENKANGVIIFDPQNNVTNLEENQIIPSNLEVCFVNAAFGEIFGVKTQEAPFKEKDEAGNSRYKLTLVS